MYKIKFANATRIRDQKAVGRGEGGGGWQSNRATHAQHQFDKLISAIIDGKAGIAWLSWGIVLGQTASFGWDGLSF